MADVLEALEKLRVAKIDERGRVYIPRTVRKLFHITLGDRIYIRLENDHFSVYTEQAIRRKLEQIRF